MKLATLKDGSRDGQLVVVSRDLAQAHYATGIATRLQQVLDDWNFLSPQLEDLYATLNGGKARHAFPFEPRQCMAPLPRAFRWCESRACLTHLDRLARAAGQALPDDARQTPVVLPGVADQLLGPTDAASFFDAGWGIDFEAGLAVLTGDVPMGATPEQALDGVRLLLLANAWTLHELLPAERARAHGLLQSKPCAAFGPVAVTPDELGEAWQGGRAHLPLQSTLNGRRVGLPDAGEGMHFHFGQVLAHLARTRPLRAGSLVGSGPISQADPSKGYSCLAEKRAQEALDGGVARTPWLAFGDQLRIDMKGRDGQSVFGAIEQRVTGPQGDEPDAHDAHDDAGEATTAAPHPPADADPPAEDA